MGLRVRKLLLTVHVTSSVGWVGALAAFLALSVASLVSQDIQTVRAACIAMELIAWFVILPLSLATLLTGIVQALGTPWGFRHYWVMAKLLLTVLATIVLLLKLGPISYLAGAAAETALSGGDLAGLRNSVMIHSVGGLLVLLVAMTLAIYKPKGMTRYGVPRQGDAGAAGIESSIGTPRWVKVMAAVIIVLALMVGAMVLGGGHGPGAHVADDKGAGASEYSGPE